MPNFPDHQNYRKWNQDSAHQTHASRSGVRVRLQTRWNRPARPRMLLQHAVARIKSIRRVWYGGTVRSEYQGARGRGRNVPIWVDLIVQMPGHRVGVVCFKGRKDYQKKRDRYLEQAMAERGCPLLFLDWEMPQLDMEFEIRTWIRRSKQNEIRIESHHP